MIRDPRYHRQRILADCLAQPGVIRQMYSVATAALEDRRHTWGGYGGTYQNPSSNLSGAVSTVDAFVARLRQLRQIADDHAGEFRSDGLRRLFTTLQSDLDEPSTQARLFDDLLEASLA